MLLQVAAIIDYANRLLFYKLKNFFITSLPVSREILLPLSPISLGCKCKRQCSKDQLNTKSRMIFREAKHKDIQQIQIVRNVVKENTLSNPALVSDQDCADFMFSRGKGWVCEIDDLIVGFAIADLIEENIWALFVLPEFEEKGIGKKLQQIMLNWYFSTGKEHVWLGTALNTRAQMFYTKSGWKQNGMHGKNEVKFEMSKKDWLDIIRSKQLST